MMATEWCVTPNRWETLNERQRERGCVRKYFGFCIYPWRSGPGKRVECSLLLFSSIRLSFGGKHGAHPPVDYRIPPTLLSPPYSHVPAALKHMYSLCETLNAPCSLTHSGECVSANPSIPSIFFLSFCLPLSHFSNASTCSEYNDTHTHLDPRTCKHLHTENAHMCSCINEQTHKATFTCSHTQPCALCHTRSYSGIQEDSGRIFCAHSGWHKQLFLLYKTG